MPTLDFPNNPLVGDQFVGTNGAIYQWDGAAWNLGSIIPGTAAGGDLTGSYPDPDIAPGVVGTIELQTNVVNRLTPTPTMPADASKVLTVTPVTGVPAWQVPTAGGTGWWNDNSVHATLKPATTGRSIELDSQTALWFGDSTTPCPAVRTPNQDIFVQSAVGRTAWLQSGQSGGVLGLTPSSASLNVDLLCQGGLQIAQFKGASPSSGSLSFVANQLLLRVAGAWQTVYPAAGGGGGGIPEAPSDGTIYGRQNASWTAVPGGSGGATGPASGDLAGVYPNPTVKFLNGITNPPAWALAYTDSSQHLGYIPPNASATRMFLGTNNGNQPFYSQVQYNQLSGAPATLPPSGAASGDLAGTYPAPTLRVGASLYLQPTTVTSPTVSSNFNSSGVLILDQTPTFDITRPVLIIVNCQVISQKLTANGIATPISILLYAGGASITDGTLLRIVSFTYQAINSGDRTSFPVTMLWWYIPSAAGPMRIKVVGTATPGDYQTYAQSGVSLSMIQFT